MNQFNKPNPGYGGNRSGVGAHAAPTETLDLDGIKFEPLPAQLFSEIAEFYADKIAKSGKDKHNKPTQIRKFYDELVMWHDRTWNGDPALREQRYQEHAPFIRMLTAKVSYAKGRDNVEANFEGFFNHCIRAVNSAETLRRCKLFIEAFMGFYKSAAAHKK